MSWTIRIQFWTHLMSQILKLVLFECRGLFFSLLRSTSGGILNLDKKCRVALDSHVLDQNCITSKITGAHLSTSCTVRIRFWTHLMSQILKPILIECWGSFFHLFGQPQVAFIFWIKNNGLHLIGFSWSKLYCAKDHRSTSFNIMNNKNSILNTFNVSSTETCLGIGAGVFI